MPRPEDHVDKVLDRIAVEQSDTQSGKALNTLFEALRVLFPGGDLLLLRLEEHWNAQLATLMELAYAQGVKDGVLLQHLDEGEGQKKAG